MKSLVLLAGGALFLSASVAAAQSTPSAQSTSPAHTRHHHTAGKHSASADGEHCCCEKEMHEMMSMMHQMMKMHAGMKMHEGMKMQGEGDMKMPMQSTTPQSDQDHSQ
jgi:hypothetical protein